MGEHDAKAATSFRKPTNDVSEEFSSNAVRLSGRHWAIATGIVVATLLLLPWAEQRMEPFRPSVDYRIPYVYSEDYWLYARYAKYASSRYPVAVIGDSVMWGHYVAPRATLPHFLNQEAGTDLFANLGLDGTRQVALTGLIKYYAGDISKHGVLLHLNPLWMSSPDADMSRQEGPADGERGVLSPLRKLVAREGQDEEQAVRLNHVPLVPQLFSRPYGYQPTFGEMAGVSIERHIPYFTWLRHMRMVYYENLGIESWSLSNPYSNPLGVISLKVRAPDDAPQGRPAPWFEGGVEQQDFPWVALDESYQWRFLKEAVGILRARGNQVFVLLGPINTHLMTEASSQTYSQLKGEMQVWLNAQGIPYYAPPLLASALYADASHPLRDGYAELARQLFQYEPFRDWLDEVGAHEGALAAVAHRIRRSRSAARGRGLKHRPRLTSTYGQ